jgi:hypothetical protein
VSRRGRWWTALGALTLAGSLLVQPSGPASADAWTPAGSTGGGLLASALPASRTAGAGIAPAAAPKPGATGQPEPSRVPHLDSPVTPADPPKEPGGARPSPRTGWTLLMSEGFEGAFPSGLWTTFDDDGAAHGEYFWDDDDYLAYAGSWSAWPANGGADGVDPEYYWYPNYADSWMVYGPFDLTGYTAAYLDFMAWIRTEPGYDYFSWMASGDGTNFSGWKTSGDSGGWDYGYLDLADWLGDSSVWIAFVFQSDYSVVDYGPFVDEVALWATSDELVPGFLRATTSPAVPSQILVDEIPRDTWGLTWLKLPPGDYEVSFADVPGFSTPASQTVTITSGLTTEVTGTFVERGWLQVMTDPAVPATISVNGVPRNDWGMWTDLDPGSYEVCFGDVPGYTTPDCQTATLTAGLTNTVTGSPTPSP